MKLNTSLTVYLTRKLYKKLRKKQLRGQRLTQQEVGYWNWLKENLT